MYKVRSSRVENVQSTPEENLEPRFCLLQKGEQGEQRDISPSRISTRTWLVTGTKVGAEPDNESKGKQ